jgi:polyhydroxybutyrate depolymerase
MIFAGCVSQASESLGPGEHRRSLQFGGQTRSFVVHIPPIYDGQRPIPVVLAFHGGMTDADYMARFSGLGRKADDAGFVAVFPNGSGENERMLTWNGGNCCGYAARNGVDDVGFVAQLLDDLAKLVRLDEKRVFAAGMSNGAVMSYRLADELSDRIAAIAAVGGPMGNETCNPKRPVPIVHFHGTKDEYAPYEGGRGRRSISGTHFLSVGHTVGTWVKANGCQTEPVVETVIEDDDGMKVVRSTYAGGREASEVVLYTIEGGGHTWPGRNPRVSFLGNSTKKFSANDTLWEFFKMHPMK